MSPTADQAAQRRALRKAKILVNTKSRLENIRSTLSESQDGARKECTTSNSSQIVHKNNTKKNTPTKSLIETKNGHRSNDINVDKFVTPSSSRNVSDPGANEQQPNRAVQNSGTGQCNSIHNNNVDDDIPGEIRNMESKTPDLSVPGLNATCGDLLTLKSKELCDINRRIGPKSRDASSFEPFTQIFGSIRNRQRTKRGDTTAEGSCYVPTLLYAIMGAVTSLVAVILLTQTYTPEANYDHDIGGNDGVNMVGGNTERFFSFKFQYPSNIHGAVEDVANFLVHPGVLIDSNGSGCSRTASFSLKERTDFTCDQDPVFVISNACLLVRELYPVDELDVQ